MLQNKLIGLNVKKKIQISRRGEGKYYAGLGVIEQRSIVIIPSSGSNFVFGSGGTVDFFLKDASGYAFDIAITGDVGVEQAIMYGTNSSARGYAPGIITPYPSPLLNSYLNFALFCPDGYFRLKNVNDLLPLTYQYHWIDAYQGFLRIEDPAGLILPNSTPKPDIAIAYQGPNYYFADGLFYLRDNYYNVWRIPYIVSDSNHENPQLALA